MNMKQTRHLLCAVSTALMLTACGGSGSESTAPTPPQVTPEPPPPPAPPTRLQRVENLWPTVIPTYIELVPWEPQNIYDSGHVLMLPVEYAFAMGGNAQMQQDLHAMFSDYLQAFDASLETNILSRFQFFYLVTRYLSLTQEQGFSADQQALYDRILEHLLFVFFEDSTRHAFSNIGTLAEVVQSKLDNKGQPVPLLRRVTTDLEFHGFAVAAEFAAMQRAATGEVTPEIQTILDLTYDTFQSEVVFTDSGWLYQPGQWEDFMDYQYAGHDIIQAELQPLPVAGIATDSSHSHRMPLWLLSQERAYPDGDPRKEYYQMLSAGFTEQFMTVVYRAPDEDFPAPRMTNYMDGHNGLYRYRQNDAPHLKLAYEAFNLSGTLLISFFPFMYNEELASAYENLEFPLREDIATLYEGLGPAIDPDSSAVTLPTYHDNGFAEMNAIIASLMTTRPE